MSTTHNPQPGERLIWFDPAPVWKGESRMLHIERVVDEPCSWRPSVMETHWYTVSGGFVGRGFLDNIPDSAEWSPPGSLPDDYTCNECRGWFNPGYWITGEEYRQAGLCLGCKHWTGAEARVRAGESIVVAGTVYSVAPDVRRGYEDCAGHAGARFDIEMPDGRVVVTHNLWNNGPVPDAWRSRLPDNARFIPPGSRATP